MPHRLIPTAFGTCGLAWNEAGLTGFQLPCGDDPGTEAGIASRDRSEPQSGDPPPDWVAVLIDRIQQHFKGKLQDFSDVPIDWAGASGFQKAVYLQTLAIRPGYKKSYGDIAKAMALGPESARAVGFALATNPWPLVVPCHRVVSANDKMTGFSAPGGIRTKTRLLALEGAELLSE